MCVWIVPSRASGNGLPARRFSPLAPPSPAACMGREYHFGASNPSTAARLSIRGCRDPGRFLAFGQVRSSSQHDPCSPFLLTPWISRPMSARPLVGFILVACTGAAALWWGTQSQSPKALGPNALGVPESRLSTARAPEPVPMTRLETEPALRAGRGIWQPFRPRMERTMGTASPARPANSRSSSPTIEALPAAALPCRRRMETGPLRAPRTLAMAA